MIVSLMLDIMAKVKSNRGSRGTQRVCHFDNYLPLIPITTFFDSIIISMRRQDVSSLR
jgi:hypothetical protein